MRAALFTLLALSPAAPAQIDSGLPKFGAAKARTFADVANLSVVAEPATARPGEVVTVRVTLSPKPGNHTYPVGAPATQASRNSIAGFKGTDLALLGPVSDPPGQEDKPAAERGKTDRVYKQAVTWELKAAVNPAAAPGKRTVALKASLNACNKDNCFLQSDPTFELEVAGAPVEVSPAVAALFAPPTRSISAAPPPVPVAAPAPAEASGHVKRSPIPPAEHAAALDSLREALVKPDAPGGSAGGGKGEFRALLVAAAFWGFVSLVTPCVFPMIPITVSLFLKQSHRSPAKTLQLAGVYCLTIVVVIGASALFLLGLFRQLSVDPVMNIGLGLLFVVFALSLFGMYDITLPGFLLRFTERRRGGGGVVGTVFGALAFSIVSFTCVAPFLGGFAGMAASGSYSQWELAAAGVTFAAAFASPFFLLALFPSLLKKLPRSGGWMDTVKAVMGFLELAAAFKFFRTAELRLLDRPEYFTYDVVLAAWVAIAAAAAAYLLGLFRLPHDDPEEKHVPVPRLVIGLMFAGLAAYLAPALLKTADGANARPRGVVYAWVDAFLLPDAAEDLPWSADLPGAVSALRRELAAGASPPKPRVFVDFTGVTCTNCQYNERNVFTKPEVRALLRRFTLVQAYTDTVPGSFYTAPPADADREAEARANLAFQSAAFGTEQLPLYAVLEPRVSGGARVVGVYDEGKINDPAAFAAFLKKALGEK